MLLKYITSTRHTRLKNIDIPGGEGMEKILKLINKYMRNRIRLRSKNEAYSVMSENNIFKLMEHMFDEKVLIDSENSNNIHMSIPDFVVDRLIMKFGLKTIAVRNIISLRIGLQEVVKNSFNKYRARKSKT